MCRYFSGLIQQDNIADRQAVAMIIHGLSTVEFLIQLLQQLRLRNAALYGRKIATVENLVIINRRSNVLLFQITHGCKTEHRVCIPLQLHRQIAILPALLELLHPI